MQKIGDALSLVDDRRVSVRLGATSGPDDVTVPEHVGRDDHANRYLLDRFVARYAAVWAYGAVGAVPGLGEDYYQTVHDEAAAAVGRGARTVLDVGCGPGRILADLAARFPALHLTGVDRSPVMVSLARRILCGPVEAGVDLDASDFGFAPVRLPGLGLTNVTVRRESLESVTDACGWDLVLASHLLDRVHDPADGLARLMSLVIPGGRLLLTCAFNYEHARQWRSLPAAASVVERVQASGWSIETLDDDLAYREQLDARGTWTHHRVLLLRARRPAGEATDGTSVTP